MLLSIVGMLLLCIDGHAAAVRCWPYNCPLMACWWQRHLELVRCVDGLLQQQRKFTTKQLTVAVDSSAKVIRDRVRVRVRSVASARFRSTVLHCLALSCIRSVLHTVLIRSVLHTVSFAYCSACVMVDGWVCAEWRFAPFTLVYSIWDQMAVLAVDICSV